MPRGDHQNGAQLKRSAFNLRHQLTAERVQRLSGALHFAENLHIRLNANRFRFRFHCIRWIFGISLGALRRKMISPLGKHLGRMISGKIVNLFHQIGKCRTHFIDEPLPKLQGPSVRPGLQDPSWQVPFHA